MTANLYPKGTTSGCVTKKMKSFYDDIKSYIIKEVIVYLAGKVKGKRGEAVKLSFY